MEGKSFSATTIVGSLPSLRQRNRSEPDVPEDVAVALLHLNDPNWDFDNSDTASFTETLELSEKDASIKRGYASSFDMGHSIVTRTSDYETESQADSRTHFHSTEAFEYEE